MKHFNFIILISLSSCFPSSKSEPLSETIFALGQIEVSEDYNKIKSNNDFCTNSKVEDAIKRFDQFFKIRQDAGLIVGGSIKNVNLDIMKSYLDSLYSFSDFFEIESQRTNFELICKDSQKILNSSSKTGNTIEIIISINALEKLLLAEIRNQQLRSCN